MISRTIDNESLVENLIKIVDDAKEFKYKKFLENNDYLKIILSKDKTTEFYDIKIERKNENKDTLIQWEFKLYNNDCTNSSIEYTNFKDPNKEEVFDSMNRNTLLEFIFNMFNFIRQTIMEIENKKVVEFLKEMF